MIFVVGKTMSAKSSYVISPIDPDLLGNHHGLVCLQINVCLSRNMCLSTYRLIVDLFLQPSNGRCICLLNACFSVCLNVYLSASLSAYEGHSEIIDTSLAFLDTGRNKKFCS